MARRPKTDNAAELEASLRSARMSLASELRSRESYVQTAQSHFDRLERELADVGDQLAAAKLALNGTVMLIGMADAELEKFGGPSA